MEQTNQKLRLALVGNRRLIREFFCLAFKSTNIIDIVGEAENLHTAVDKLRGSTPDVIIADIALSLSDAIETFPQIKKTFSDAKILAVAHDLTDDYIQKLIEAGARGYVSTESASTENLISAIKAVSRGEFWLDRKITAELLDKGLKENSVNGSRAKNPEDALSSREKEVLAHLSKGYSNKEIAAALFISDKTVKCHINNIFKKLKINRRIEALLFAIKHGIIEQKNP